MKSFIDRIFEYRASGWIAWRIHTLFAFIYALLFARLVISVYEGEFDLLNLLQNSSFVRAVKRLSSLIYLPFSLPDFELSLILTILTLTLLHKGLFLQVFTNQTNSMSNKISLSEKVLNFCRAAFYLVGLLLLILVTLRIAVMLYQDLTVSRSEIIISKPAASPNR